jgi:UDP-N-acetyl-D-glucosamine/UDP-N-acetyl-D-galactosamine dehydrogenase
VAHGRKLAVIGLRYIGLPVPVAFAWRRAPVTGFDIDADCIAELGVHGPEMDVKGKRDAHARLTQIDVCLP